MGTVTVRWLESKLFLAQDSHAHPIVLGKDPRDITQWAGAKASDLLLIAAAACPAWDVVEILLKQRAPLKDLRVECRAEQLPNPPYTYTCIHLHYQVRGDIQPHKLEKAIRLAEDKYCSVLSTLRLAIPVTSDFEIEAG